MILVIRGHIRDAFTTLELINFVKKIHSTEPKLKIFIHTWNVFANNVSWRPVNYDDADKAVTEQVIYNYFADLKHLIGHIIIDDDQKIQLVGNLRGTVTEASPMSMIGWKNYWYGKYKIIDYLYNNKNIDNNEMIVNFRFDLFQIYGDDCPLEYRHMITAEYLSDFIKNNVGVNFTKNQFIFDFKNIGIDNIYLGNINTMHKLTHQFFYKLDDIARKYNYIRHQEMFVYIVNYEAWFRIDIVARARFVDKNLQSFKLYRRFRKPLRSFYRALRRLIGLGKVSADNC